MDTNLTYEVQTAAAELKLCERAFGKGQDIEEL